MIASKKGDHRWGVIIPHTPAQQRSTTVAAGPDSPNKEARREEEVKARNHCFPICWPSRTHPRKRGTSPNGPGRDLVTPPSDHHPSSSKPAAQKGARWCHPRNQCRKSGPGSEWIVGRGRRSVALDSAARRTRCCFTAWDARARSLPCWGTPFFLIMGLGSASNRYR